MPVLKLIKNKVSHAKKYYYINSKGTISKKDWKDSRIDFLREKTDNFFLDFEEALEELNKYGNKSH